MKNQSIRAVLDDWDYDQALELLRQHSDSPAMANVLSGGRTAFFQKKLRSELITLLDKEDTPTFEPAPEAPAAVQAVQKARNQALRKQDHLRGQLVLLVEQKATPEVLAPIAQEIRDLSKELRKHWDDLRYFEQHGMLPPPIPDELSLIFDGISTVSDLTRIRNNARSNISRGKNKLTADKLNYWLTVRNEADRKINLLEA